MIHVTIISWFRNVKWYYYKRQCLNRHYLSRQNVGVGNKVEQQTQTEKNMTYNCQMEAMQKFADNAESG